MAKKPKAKARKTLKLPEGKKRKAPLTPRQRQSQAADEHARWLAAERELKPYNVVKDYPPPPTGILLVQTAEGVLILGKMIEGRFFVFPQTATEMGAGDFVRWVAVSSEWDESDEDVVIAPQPEESADGPAPEPENRP